MLEFVRAGDGADMSGIEVEVGVGRAGVEVDKLVVDVAVEQCM
jgi:hypothetical protein